MMGLVFIFIFIIYLVISVIIIFSAIKAARKRGIKGWKWGVPAGLFMYLIVFWDHIPTLIMHKYYCETEAGFWVYKTPEQWVNENPGVAETLTWQERSEEFKNKDGSHGYILNERFKNEYRRLINIDLLPIRMGSQSVIDMKNNEVMIKHVGVSSGYGSIGVGIDPNAWKMWVGSKACVSDIKEFGKLHMQFKKMGDIK